MNQTSDNNHVPRLRKTFGLNPREPLQDFFTYVDNKIGQYATDAEIIEAVAEVMKGEASTHYYNILRRQQRDGELNCKKFKK